MNDNIIWYISKDNYLEEKEAELFLESKMKSFDQLVNKINNTLHSICNDNRMNTTDNIVNNRLAAGETLSIIRIQLEMFVDDMNDILE